jgi:von Willebrand factor type A domain
MAVSASRHGRTWLLALLVSLAVHGGVGLALTLLPGPGSAGSEAEGLQVDACALDTAGDEGDASFLTADANPAEFAAVLLASPTGEPARLPSPTIEEPCPRTVSGSTSPGAQSLAAGNATTPRPGTSFFHVPAQGRTFVYLIDRSSSMGLHGALATACRQLLASLEQLPLTAQFQVIVYNRSAEPLLTSQPGLMAASPENVQQVGRQLALLAAEGGTDHLPALRRALALHPDVLFLLTDADDLTAEHLRVAAQLNPGRHTIIHTIELNTLNRDRSDLPMHLLARDHGGTYQAVDLQESY